MMKILSRLHTASFFPLATAIVTAQSARQRLRTFNKKPKVLFEKPYDGRKIMLLALYEKGVLRPDVIRLLQAAKAEGLYILAVNTLRIKDPSALEDVIDCYIERPNFGRDFGSYKTGFLHLFARGWHDTCPRLLMINDSIFFSTVGLAKFLTDMMQSEVEVLGSTENHEIEYHLGSFCIAMAQSILKTPKFQRYWNKYALSDVRPKVIRTGEMKLSKTLKRCVSAPTQLTALYSSSRYITELNQNNALRDFSTQNGRISPLTHWRRFSPKKVIGFVRGNFSLPLRDLPGDVEISVTETATKLDEAMFMSDSAAITTFLKANLKNPDDLNESIVNDAIIAELSSAFMVGSQIHQNACILHYMGLPIIKLDGVYRGMFGPYDTQRLSARLPEQEKAELLGILFERPFGGDVLIGWKRAAFMRGLI